jgi:hypothetical protein
MWLLLLHKQPNLKREFQPCSGWQVYDMPTIRPSDEKRVLYEQVTDVKAFFLIRVFAFAVIALLLLSTGFVFALW